jgi:predicted nucleic acid-binding protein
MAHGDFRVTLSTALCLEYEDVLNRPEILSPSSRLQVREFLDSFCVLAEESYIYFKWRPFLRDAKDDLIFECALAAGATHIVTYNRSDFIGVETFGISVVTPAQLLAILKKP